MGWGSSAERVGMSPLTRWHCLQQSAMLSLVAGLGSRAEQRGKPWPPGQLQSGSSRDQRPLGSRLCLGALFYSE